MNFNGKEQKQPKENGKITKETQTTLYIPRSNPLLLELSCAHMLLIKQPYLTDNQSSPSKRWDGNELH